MAPISYGDISVNRTREVYVSNVKAVTILSPVTGSMNGSPILISYRLDSDYGVTANINDVDVDGKCTYVQYSTDSGSNWNNCSIDSTNPSHSGLTGLVTDANTDDFVFAWDSAADLTTAFQSTTVRLRLKASDGSVDCPFSTQAADFTIDMLPDAPMLISPPDQYFDRDTTPDFIFTVPTDPGSDRMTFRIEIDNNSDFLSATIDDNSYDDDDGRFMHRISTSPGTKNGANSQAYYVRDLSVTSFSGTAVLFSSLTDYHKDTAIPATLTNPQILLINKADRRCFIDYATITATGFTITKSGLGIDTNGLVDLIIYAGTAGSFESYWVNIAALSTTTTYTLGVAPFDTDVLGNTIPASITDLMPMVLEGNDRLVYFSGVGNGGFTLNLSGSGVSSTAKVRVCLFSPSNEAYQDRTVSSALWATSTNIDYEAAMNDETNGGASWPDYIPGAISTSAMLADRMVFVATNNDSVDVQMSGSGIATTAAIGLRTWGENDTSIPYYTAVPRTGVPDTYEGDYVRYRTVTADALSEDTYYWRVRAGNFS